MQEKLKSHINNNLPFLTKGRLLIAVSGGVDSVVLTHLCHQLKLQVNLAHCNFNLRQDESNADEDFILQLAEDLDLEVFIENFETKTYAEENKLSIQMAARELRYNWFQDLADLLQFDYILTAHHADDNLETFLINLSRGTGLDGLMGIPEINANIVRPLLIFSRNDIETYAKEKQLKWREDSSNASTKYLRNKLRHEVIPTLKETNPQLLLNFQKTQSHLSDSKDIIEDALVRVQKKVVTTKGNTILLDIEKLQKLSNPKAYMFELLKDFGFKEWDDVSNLLYAQSGKIVESSTHRLLKDRTHLILTELKSKVIQSDCEESQIIQTPSAQVKFSHGTIKFETVKQLEQTESSVIYVDKDLLKYPLTVRKWEKGDYFYPFGMQGKKKLSKFFKDEKWSLLEKEQAWLLSSQNDIVWILNKRADNRFKVTDTTKQIIKITIQTNET